MAIESAQLDVLTVEVAAFSANRASRKVFLKVVAVDDRTGKGAV
jgi:hypothetical protein